MMYVKKSKLIFFRKIGCSFILLLLPVSIWGFVNDFQKGFLLDSNKAPFKKIYDQYGHLPRFLLNVGEGKYYSLSGDGGGVGAYDLSGDASPQGWPLTRWENLYYSPEKASIWEGLGVSESELGQIRYSPYADGIGCYNQSPLRYGQLLEGAEDVLVLFLNQHLIVFSPSAEKIIFHEILDNSDWLTEPETNELKNRWPDAPAQYASSLIADNARGSIEPGIRVYSKLYFSDFNNNQKPDIVVWRKSYRSRDVGDVKGFRLTDDHTQHYELSSSGEYLPQETEPEIIQGWLSSNDLTWSDGFPSESECEGEEGELIPEMHDPLLNDPEVLQ